MLDAILGIMKLMHAINVHQGGTNPQLDASPSIIFVKNMIRQEFVLHAIEDMI
jgi:hypothetical protein